MADTSLDGIGWDDSGDPYDLTTQSDAGGGWLDTLSGLTGIATNIFGINNLTAAQKAQLALEKQKLAAAGASSTNWAKILPMLVIGIVVVAGLALFLRRN